MHQIQSLRARLFEHQQKYADIQHEGGYVSSIDREIREFEAKIQELETELNNYEWKFCEQHKGWADFLNNRCVECGHQDW